MLRFDDLLIYDNFFYKNNELSYILETNDYFFDIINAINQSYLNKTFDISDTEPVTFSNCSRFFEFNNSKCLSNFFKFFFFLKPTTNLFFVNTNFFYY